MNKLLLFFLLFISLFFFRKADINEINIDKVFLINLERSKERLISSDIIFKANNINYLRFNGIEGKNLTFLDEDNEKITAKSILDKKKLFILNKEYKVNCGTGLNFIYKYQNNKYPYKEYKRSLTVGEIGCVCSHFSLAKKLVNSDDKNYLIFEDDFTIEKNFNEKLDNILKNAPKDCEIIYLYHNKSGINLYFNHFVSSILYGYNKDIDYVTKVVKSISGLVGYILTKDGANKILSEIEQKGLVNLGADHYLARVLINKNKLRACIIRNKIVTWGENGLNSTTGVFLRNDGTKIEFK